MPGEGRGLTSGALWKGPRVWRVAMLPTTSVKDSAASEATVRAAKDGESLSVCRLAKPVGEPDAANPHVRFDERGMETEHGREMGHRQTKGPATVSPCLNHCATPRLYPRSSQDKGSKCAVKRRRSSVGAIPTRQGVAPAGSNRSGEVGDDRAEAFDGKDRIAIPRAGRP